jgi:hypothetical protein
MRTTLTPSSSVMGCCAAMAWACLMLLGLAGCSAKATTDSDSYFPLQAGHRWVYDVKTEWENNTVEHEERVIFAQGADTIEGGEAWRRRSESGVDYWLRSDASGVYRVAMKSDVEVEPQLDKAKRYVLRTPLTVGTNWQHNTTTYLLQRRNEFPREIRHTHPNVPMLYTIEATDEAVQTRAGTFERCLRVKGVSALRLYADAVVGWKDMVLTTREWYCQGVGLVRLVREEPAQSTFLTGGTVTMELTSWQ